LLGFGGGGGFGWGKKKLDIAFSDVDLNWRCGSTSRMRGGVSEKRGDKH